MRFVLIRRQIAKKTTGINKISLDYATTLLKKALAGLEQSHFRKKSLPLHFKIKR